MSVNVPVNEHVSLNSKTLHRMDLVLSTKPIENAFWMPNKGWLNSSEIQRMPGLWNVTLEQWIHHWEGYKATRLLNPVVLPKVKEPFAQVTRDSKADRTEVVSGKANPYVMRGLVPSPLCNAVPSSCNDQTPDSGYWSGSTLADSFDDQTPNLWSGSTPTGSLQSPKAASHAAQEGVRHRDYRLKGFHMMLMAQTGLAEQRRRGQASISEAQRPRPRQFRSFDGAQPVTSFRLLACKRFSLSDQTSKTPEGPRASAKFLAEAQEPHPRQSLSSGTQSDTSFRSLAFKRFSLSDPMPAYGKEPKKSKKTLPFLPKAQKPLLIEAQKPHPPQTHSLDTQPVSSFRLLAFKRFSLSDPTPKAPKKSKKTLPFLTKAKAPTARESHSSGTQPVASFDLLSFKRFSLLDPMPVPKKPSRARKFASKLMRRIRRL